MPVKMPVRDAATAGATRKHNRTTTQFIILTVDAVKLFVIT